MDAPPSLVTQDDRATIDHFREGDRAAFQTLHDRYAQRVLAFLYASGLQESDVNDLSQEAWMRAFSARATFSGGNFAGWIVTIAARVSIDARRRKRPDRLPEGYDAGGDCEKERQIMREIIQQCFDALAAANGDFAAAVLDDYLGLTTAEIAAKHGIAAGTVYTRLNRGREMLKDCIQPKMA